MLMISSSYRLCIYLMTLNIEHQPLYINHVSNCELLYSSDNFTIMKQPSVKLTVNYNTALFIYKTSCAQTNTYST